jgi:hypothetical protein
LLRIALLYVSSFYLAAWAERAAIDRSRFSVQVTAG